MSAPEAATELVADVAEEVAEVATNVAEVSRGLNGRGLSLAFGGFVVGAGVGGTAAYFILRRKLELKFREIADAEIEDMQEHYREKLVALESKTKGDLQDLVEERGYAPPNDESASPPMAVTPPQQVVERSQEVAEEEPKETRTRPPVPADPPEPVRNQNLFRDVAVEDIWDWAKERARRSPLRPYVIHIDERKEEASYDSVTYTYYEQDNVVCDESDQVIDQEDRDRIFGEGNLNMFGHGSGDPNIVYIRNDKLDMDIEMVRSPNSYAQEVHGFDPPSEEETIRHSERRRGRSFDDD